MTDYDEDELQKYAAYRLTVACRKTLWFHVPNGKKRDPRTARLLKQMGVRPGVADLLMFRTGGRPPVAVELKVPKKGRLSDDQKKFRDHWQALGGIYDTAWTPQEIDALQFKYALD